MTMKKETPAQAEIADGSDIFECAKFDITDELLDKAKIVAYMYNLQVDNDREETKPYMPKFFPEKAIDIMVKLNKEFVIEIFLLTQTGEWDSKFRYKGKICKLSADQMEQFFKSDFYRKMLESISKKWPAKDPTYMRLLKACVHRKMRVGFSEQELSDELREVDQPGKRKDLANKDTSGDGKRDYTSTGRKILHFTDMGVNGKSGEYYCWPNPKYPFKWSQWKNWKKIKPLCKMAFKYNGRRYMVSLSLFDENFDNRGFRGADTQWTPPLAWLTPGECAEVMRLSIVRKFTKECVRRIKEYLDMKPSEVYEKINNKDKITVREIEKTQRVIRHVIQSALKQNQADTYRWED